MGRGIGPNNIYTAQASTMVSASACGLVNITSWLPGNPESADPRDLVNGRSGLPFQPVDATHADACRCVNSERLIERPRSARTALRSRGGLSKHRNRAQEHLHSTSLDNGLRECLRVS